MKYGELVNFEPIESVIQLEKANSLEAAQDLVRTFVISDRMAEQLRDLVLPNLQFLIPADTKGLLVVGNYGTGKSHLLSLLAALAEHPALGEVVTDQTVAKAAQVIAGKFKVVRVELPSTKKSLRNILCGRLEDFLDDQGVSFAFPPDEQVDSNKDDLSRMMALFAEKYPDHGLLLVVDELLDYLKSRNHQDLILDLGFLREIGEICKHLRLRFIAGVQETLFDNSKFQFVAESLRRVKDRFEQVRIVRQDVAHVVSERLLKKSADQKARIREHLQRFTPLYNGMAERLEEFVQLFPVHPTYLEVFESISVAEKREILKTLSAEISGRLDQELPKDEPGLVSYDSYWEKLQGNVVLRADPDIREVIEKAKKIENRVQQALPAKYTHLRPLAMRLIHGLAVQRLATDGIRAKIGPTAEELQTGLCLLVDMHGMGTSDFLRTNVENCLSIVIQTMSGEFIAHNVDNGQYYLDVDRDIDHDAKIQDKAETLSDAQLDDYYFEALTVVLERADQAAYVRGHQIWEHELDWREHRITRRGYLFFGAPNQRSTAQPPRDFYLYFLQVFEPPHFEDHKLADEVFFKLVGADKTFRDTLRLYAGAREMANAATTGTRKVYQDKAEVFRKKLVEWLRANMLTALEVVHQGVPRKLVECLKGHKTGGAAVSELVELAGSLSLSASFADRYPDYPTFPARLRVTNLSQPTEDVVKHLAGGGVRSALATTLLEGLELLDGDKLKPHQSRYAKVVVDKLTAKPPGQVLNRRELLTAKHDVERETQYQLEPELLVCVLLALSQAGSLAVGVTGKKLDAGNLSDAAKMPLGDLLNFKHVEKPKGLPLAELLALFELLGLPEGLIRNENTHDEAVRQLRLRSEELTGRVVVAAQHVQTGLPCWGSELLAPEVRDHHGKKLADLKSFLEGLQGLNTPGKLKNFSKSVDEIRGHAPTLGVLDEVEGLQALVQEVTPLTSYLGTAAAVLPHLDPWRSSMEATRAEWRAKLADPLARSAADFRQKLTQALSDAKASYKSTYLGHHKKARLGVNEDSKKKELLKEPRLETLKKLSVISLLPVASLTDLQGRLARLQPCYALVKDDLDATPLCPQCSFRPQDEAVTVGAASILQQLDNQLDTMLTSWCLTLLENLDDPTAQESILLLPGAQKAAVEQFLKVRQFPEKLSNDLVQGIQQALSGLLALAVKPVELVAALYGTGAPSTVAQFQARFEEFLDQLLRGKDPDKVRLLFASAQSDESDA